MFTISGFFTPAQVTEIVEATTNSIVSAQPDVIINTTPAPNMWAMIVVGTIPVLIGVWFTAKFVNKKSKSK